MLLLVHTHHTPLEAWHFLLSYMRFPIVVTLSSVSCASLRLGMRCGSIYKKKGRSSITNEAFALNAQHTIRGSSATENRIVISPCRMLPSLTPLLPPCEGFTPSVHVHVTVRERRH